MAQSDDSTVQKVLHCIQSLAEVCRDDKHAYLKDACHFVLERCSSTVDAEEKANLLYVPFKIACSVQSKSEQRLFVFSAEGIDHLLSSSLFDASTPFAPPSVPHKEKKRGLFGAKDATTPNASMQQLDGESSCDGTALVDVIISTLELRTTILRGEYCHTPRKPHEQAIFHANLKCLATLMTDSRFDVHGRKLQRCFQIALVCLTELQPSDLNSESEAAKILTGVISVSLSLAYPASDGGESYASGGVVNSDAVKSAPPAMKHAMDCLFLLEVICAPPKDRRRGGPKDDYLQMQPVRAIKLHLLRHFLVEADDRFCNWAQFLQYFAKYTTPFILAMLGKKDAHCYSQSLRVLHAIIVHRSELLKSKVSYFILGVLLPLLEFDHVTVEKKEAILSFLQQLSANPQVVAQWFVNFDCRIRYPCLVENLVMRLGKLKILRSDPSSGKLLTQRLYGVFCSLSHSMRTLLEHEDDGSEPVTPGSPVAHRLPADIYSSSTMLKLIAQKQKYKEAISLFNDARKYREAIELASTITGLMDNTSPYAIAGFLMTCEDLNPAEVGNYLGRNDPATREVLKAFVDLHDFGGITVDEAVRLLLGSFRISGEAETVDRTMDIFAESYCQQNPGSLSQAAVVVLAFSVVMLNTDAHSPRVKDKMSLEQYTKNLRGTNDSGDFPASTLSNIYRRVTAREIKPWRPFPTFKLVAGAAESGASADVVMYDTAVEFISRDVQGERFVVSVGTPAVAGAMLDNTWTTFLPAFSFPLEETDNKELIDTCLDGVSNCVAVAAKSGRQSELKAFLSALLTFTHLTNLRTMKHKNVRAVSLLIDTAFQYPNDLGEGWEEVLRCISYIGKIAPVELLADKHGTDGIVQSRQESSDTHTSGELGESRTDGPRAGGGGLARTSSRQRVDCMDAEAIESVGKENASVLFPHISRETIDPIFLESEKKMRGASLETMVRCLCKISSEAFAAHPPSLFMFRYLVDVLEVNYCRPVDVWRKLWTLATEEILRIILSSTSQSQAVYAFRVFRKFALCQLSDPDLDEDGGHVVGLLETFQTVAETAKFELLTAAVVSTLAQLLRSQPHCLLLGSSVIIDTLMSSFTRVPSLRTSIAVIMHQISTYGFLDISNTSESMTKVYLAWGSIAKADSSLEKYALAHIRLLISSLFHCGNRRRLARAHSLLDMPLDEDAAPPPSGEVAPSLAMLKRSVRYLDESEHATPPPFSLCVLGFNELMSLAAAFQCRQTLAEGAVDVLLDATNALRIRAQLSHGGPSRDSLRGDNAEIGGGEDASSQTHPFSLAQWRQLYAQCALSLVDVYVGACVQPEVLAATKPKTNPVDPTAARRAARRASAAGAVQRNAEEVSAMALALLEKHVSLLVRQELTIREEVEQAEEHAAAAAASATSMEAASGAVGGDESENVSLQVIERSVEVAAGVGGDGGSTDMAMSPASVASAPLGTVDRLLLGTTEGDDNTSPVNSVHEEPLEASRPDTSGQEDAAAMVASVLDEARRDEVEEVNLYLIECLLTRLCPCEKEKIRDLGFLALRKLISSRLECALTTADRDDMTELANKLIAALQSFFQEHVVERCLRPSHVSLSGVLSVDGAAEPPPEAGQATATTPSVQANGEHNEPALPSEAVLRACIGYVDLIGMVIQQEVLTEDGDGFDPVYEGLVSELAAARILKDFRAVYVDTSRVLSAEYFAKLRDKDGAARAAGERVLAMLVTLECTISNVFIEMEVSREVTAESQFGSPGMSVVRSPLPRESSGIATAGGSSVFVDGPCSPLMTSATKKPVELQVEKFRNFVLTAFLQASEAAKQYQSAASHHNCPSAMNASMANQQQLLATRTVVRSFLESLQRAPDRLVRRLMPKYRTELCELVKSCDEEIAPILGDILLRYLSGV